MSSTRNITKSLAVVEDIAVGRGTVLQKRGIGTEVDLHVVAESVEALVNIDTTKYTRARVYSGAAYVDYVYLATKWELLTDNYSFIGKIFQSPTNNLTKVSTFAGGVGVVYEVRKTSDDSLATIYSYASGTAEIVQNGTSNVSDGAGVVEFYIADGDYTIVVGAVSVGLSVGVTATKVLTSDGRNVQERLDDLPSEVDAAGTAATLISQHNSDASAHPELSGFITSEADRAEAAADAAALSGNVYTNTTAGIAATVDGDYFSVVSPNGDTYLDLYKNESGVAVFKKSYATSDVTFAKSQIGIIESVDSSMNFDFANDQIIIGPSVRLSYGNHIKTLTPSVFDISTLSENTKHRLIINTDTDQLTVAGLERPYLEYNEVILGFFRKSSREVSYINNYYINGKPDPKKQVTLISVADHDININSVEGTLTIRAGVQLVSDGSVCFTIQQDSIIDLSPFDLHKSLYIDILTGEFVTGDGFQSISKKYKFVTAIKGDVLSNVPKYSVNGFDTRYITPNKTSFITESGNLFNKETITPESTLTEDGNTRPIATRFVSDFIPVKPSRAYSVTYPTTYFRYDKDKNIIGVLGASSEIINTTIDTRFLRLAPLNDSLNVMQITEGAESKPYKPFGAQYHEKLVVKMHQVEGYTDIEERLAKLENTISNKSPESLLNFEHVQNVVGLAATGTAFDNNFYFFGKTTGNTVLQKTTDSCETFAEGMSISSFAPDSEGVMSFCVFNDGTVSITTRDGKTYHAQAFDSVPTLVHSMTTRTSKLAINYYNKGTIKYVFAGGYDHTTERKNMYISTDGGLNFTLLKAGGTLNSGNNHWHAACYDDVSDIIWLSEGDGDNSKLMFSTDFGSSWTEISGTHPTTIYSFNDRVVFGRDKTGEKPGIDAWNRDGLNPLNLNNSLTFREDISSPDVYPTRSDWYSLDKGVYYMLFPEHVGTERYIYATGDSGRTWHLVYQGSNINRWFTGEDSNGFVYASGELGLYKAKATKWR